MKKSFCFIIFVIFISIFAFTVLYYDHSKDNNLFTEENVYCNITNENTDTEYSYKSYLSGYGFSNDVLIDKLGMTILPNIGVGIVEYDDNKLELPVHVETGSEDYDTVLGLTLFVDGVKTPFKLKDGTLIEDIYIFNVYNDTHILDEKFPDQGFYIYVDLPEAKKGDILQITYDFISQPYFIMDEQNYIINPIFYQGPLMSNVFYLKINNDIEGKQFDKNYATKHFTQNNDMCHFNNGVVTSYFLVLDETVDTQIQTVVVNQGETINMRAQVIVGNEGIGQEHRVVMYRAGYGVLNDVFGGYAYFDAKLVKGSVIEYDVYIDTAELEPGIYNYYLIGRRLLNTSIDELNATFQKRSYTTVIVEVKN